jgi:hypothetical protein
MINAATIARARTVPIEVEVAKRGVNLKSNHKQLTGPCPLCGGTDRFNVDPRKNLWICRGCRVGGDVIKLVQHLDGCSFVSAVEMLISEDRQKFASSTSVLADLHRTAASDERRQRLLAASLWAKRKPIGGTLAERYLFWRGIGAEGAPATLGYLPPFQAHAPAMVAAFGFPQETEPGLPAAPVNVTGIHLTKLTPEGRKTAKTMLGPSAGQPIVIAPPNDLLGLAIAEGIEDALSVHMATGLGSWAAGSATRMPALAKVVPDYIETVSIWAHPDPTGQKNARELAGLLQRRGVEVYVEGLRDRDALVGGAQ